MAAENFHKQPTSPGLKKEQAPPLQIPKQIGIYRIESLLEKGGMSILYLATHPETKEPVTIKVMSPQLLSYPEMTKRFTNEAEIIAMASHPNIVQLYGYGEWEGGLYIAMEFIEGISLRQYILQTPVSLSRALDIIIDIAYALCHLHTHGAVHRDLKPENILISENGVIKLIDFGIAQLLTETHKSMSYTRHQLIGTPVYMSPEQRQQPHQVCFASDIYSLGIIAYELILGRLCHGQIHLSLMPRGVQKILHRALQPKLEDRYQDVVDFISDLSAYRNSPTMQKEKKAGDPVTEMAEEMKQVQHGLVVTSPPLWPGMEIGFAEHQSVALSGICYDFFEIQPGRSYGIFVGEASSSKRAGGVIYTALLRGMVRSLCRLTEKPTELMMVLNDIIFKDAIQQTFNINYLVFTPELNQVCYLSCGQGSLWQIVDRGTTPIKIIAPNPRLGIVQDIEFIETTVSWNKGDTLVLNSFAISQPTGANEFSEELFETTLKETVDRQPQKQVEAILRKARVSSSKLLNQRSIVLIGIHRK